MYYATHRLYNSKEGFLRLMVVETEQGRVLSLFPFDGERESMIWVDALLLSSNENLDGRTDVLEALLCHSNSGDGECYLYSLKQTGEKWQLRMVR